MYRHSRQTDKGVGYPGGHVPEHLNFSPKGGLSPAVLNGTSAPARKVKLRSAKDLEDLRDTVMLHEKGKLVSIATSVSTCSIPRGAARVADAIEKELHQRCLDDCVGLRRTGCRGLCEIEPVVVIYPQELIYQQVTPLDVPEIVAETVMKGRVLDRLLYRDPSSGRKCVRESEIPFYQKQRRVLLESHMYLDPRSIEDYVAAGGYSALCRILHEMHPADVLEDIDRSGLCSRGLRGLPTADRWATCHERTRCKHATYIVCDSRQADPGAHVSCSLLEGNPHRIVEGMIIGAFAVGSHLGHLYLASRYSLAAANLAIALNQAREYGILGKDILGSEFDFDITFSCESGTLACDEFSAEDIDPTRELSEDIARESHDQESNPVLAASVETWANVPIVIGQGRRWYSSVGTQTGNGTKVLALVGATQHTGLVEVPMGASLREIVFDIGGGVRNGKALKAVQVGGPSGSFVPASQIDVQPRFGSMAEPGVSPGSGTIVVLDEGNCMVDITNYFVRFLAEKLCGKCTGCHPGLSNMADILRRLTRGQGKEDDIALVEQLAKAIRAGSECNTGANAANAVLSSLRYFRHEYRAHVFDRHCPSGVCKSLITFAIDAEKCRGCRECAEECPENAISGGQGEPQSIDSRLCTRCRICEEVCTHGAILVR